MHPSHPGRCLFASTPRPSAVPPETLSSKSVSLIMLVRSHTPPKPGQDFKTDKHTDTQTHRTHLPLLPLSSSSLICERVASTAEATNPKPPNPQAGQFIRDRKRLRSDGFQSCDSPIVLSAITPGQIHQSTAVITRTIGSTYTDGLPVLPSEKPKSCPQSGRQLSVLPNLAMAAFPESQ